MKSNLVLSILLFIVCLSPAVAQDNSIQQYHYNVSGRILDEKSNPAVNITVCLVPSMRPINGRIPCVKTDSNGMYSVGDYDIPDKYKVSASNSESIFVITNGNVRAASSKPFVFKARDENKKVNLILKGR